MCLCSELHDKYASAGELWHSLQTSDKPKLQVWTYDKTLEENLCNLLCFNTMFINKVKFPHCCTGNSCFNILPSVILLGMSVN